MNQMGTDICENVQVSRYGGEAAYLSCGIGELPVYSSGPGTDCVGTDRRDARQALLQGMVLLKQYPHTGY